ncbi:MAG: hypothetical protein IKG14_00235 [Clostridia bacterium]|nr:hypothetical protein [Clostridia bacterium]
MADQAQLMAKIISGAVMQQIKHVPSRECFVGYVGAAPRMGQNLRVTYLEMYPIPGHPGMANVKVRQRQTTPVFSAKQVSYNVWEVETRSGTRYWLEVVHL